MSPQPLSAGTARSTDWEARLEQAIVERIDLPGSTKTDSRYEVWFRGRTKFVLNGDQLVIGVPNLHFQEWLSKTFAQEVRSAAAEVLGGPVTVRFVIDPELFRQSRAEQKAAETPKAEATPPAPEPTTRTRPKKADTRPAGKRKWRTLAEFVVGACNRVAHASAQSVVEEPGLGANPLVIYGPVGTGKTHLLEGIYSGLRRKRTDLRVRYVTAEEFMNRFVQAMHLSKQGAFRRDYRECSVLLLDDLTFLAGKKATQVEFLHTFDALVTDGRQVVVTMDCHPRLSDDLLPELADRLLGGAVWSVLPPDAQTRLDILRAKSVGALPLIPDEVLQFLGQNLRGNVRELEGAVHNLRHYSRVTGRVVNVALAREALGDLLRHAVRTVGLADIDGATCVVLRLPSGTLQSKKRTWAVSHPRMIAVYLCRKHTSSTYGEISIYFGNKSHGTAVAAEKKVRQWLEKNGALKIGEREWSVKDLIERIQRELGR